MGRHHVVHAGQVDAESLAEDRDDALRLHLADARQGQQPSLEVAPVGRLRPDPARVVAVVAGDRRASCWTLPAIEPGKRWSAGGSRKTVVQSRRVRRRDPRGVEVAEPALQLGRAAERLLDGDLLVEREADEQGQRAR